MISDERRNITTTTGDAEYIGGEREHFTTTGGETLEGGETTTTTTYITSSGGGVGNTTSIGSSRIPTRKQIEKQTRESTSSETDANGITTTTGTVTETENGETTVTITFTKMDQSGREISSSSKTNDTYDTVTSGEKGDEGEVITTIITTNGGKLKLLQALLDTRSIKRTSTYGRSGGKISRGKKKSTATTASKVNRSGDQNIHFLNSIHL
ncbi:1227_t:CDS:2 [Funneliformis geosporum]|uniref:7231_t:CDS:1 n=1 Tax=Funneliformis geosporum TaxID=1117311 RepID=A0A9W4SXG4_9GLOM|nr:7231_t:CDS:2 [Funneliformis geosporum]CAI2186116.1 1227_t:CDS:2 [Funneliformis geosporum]